jgi:hypothetical protein
MQRQEENSGKYVGYWEGKGNSAGEPEKKQLSKGHLKNSN